MRWKQFLTPVKSITPEKARQFIAAHKEGDLTLLDVRQPHEYEKERLPGAKLIPLPRLVNRLNELDPEKPVIVY